MYLKENFGRENVKLFKASLLLVNISQREIGLCRRFEKASQSQNFMLPGFFTSHELPKEGTSEHVPETPVKVATVILTGT